MKIGIRTDVHWCKNESIVNTRGKKFSRRLENLIESVNWSERLFENQKVDIIVDCGDFFNKPNLISEEITALKEIEWAPITHYMVVGNHDSDRGDLAFSSTDIFSDPQRFKLIREITSLELEDTDILFLPYCLEENRHPLPLRTSEKIRVAFSHNDIAGVNYGFFESKEGYKTDDIKSKCDLFINGHIHNGGYIDKEKTILNLGNLTGKNFTEDSFKYKHYAAILDVDSNGPKISFYENPYAMNFKQIRVENEEDLSKLEEISSYDVVSLICLASLSDRAKEILDSKSPMGQRVLSIYESKEEEVEISSLASTNYLNQFREYVLSKLDNTDALKEELIKVVNQLGGGLDED